VVQGVCSLEEELKGLRATLESETTATSFWSEWSMMNDISKFRKKWKPEEAFESLKLMPRIESSVEQLEKLTRRLGNIHQASLM